MRSDIRSCYLVFDSGKKGPVYVAPHAAVAFEKPGDYQDTGTHYIAWRLAQNSGKAVISSISRERHIGIDFYRSPPDEKGALENFEFFLLKKKRMSRPFRKKYAWVAKDSDEHEYKKNTFANFWGEFSSEKRPVFFIHRQFLNPIRHPSIIDVIPFNNEKKVREVVREINAKYTDFLNDMLPMYKQSFYFKSECIRFKQTLKKTLNPRVFRNIEPKLQRRLERFDRKISKYPHLKLTFMKNFKGSAVREQISKTFPEDFEHPIIQFEISEFLSRRFPEVAIKLIKEFEKKL